MKHVQSILAYFCIVLTASNGLGQQLHWYTPATRPYEPKALPPVNVSNTGRIESLLRGGKLYLSLQDAIALALENNIDIEVERYLFPLAQADLLRAQSGNSTQGIPTATSAGATGLSATSAQSFLSIISSERILPAACLTGAPSSVNPNGFDPTINSTVEWGHITSPQQNTVTTGTTSLVTTNTIANFNIQQNFATGGSATLSYNNYVLLPELLSESFQPVTNAYLDLCVSQPLLQGFGIATNNRPIRIAKNNLRAADIVFKQQVIVTVETVVQAYWLLVSANEDVEVKRKALALSQKLYSDNQKQVDVGSLAPIEIVRAEAEVASDEQALVTSQTTVLQEETILKNALSRNGLANPAVAAARIVPPIHIRIPAAEKLETLQELVAVAVENRPELQQSRMQLENQKIALTGSRNLMLPTLTAFADVRNTRLVGRSEYAPRSRHRHSLLHQSESVFRRRLRQCRRTDFFAQFSELFRWPAIEHSAAKSQRPG